MNVMAIDSSKIDNVWGQIAPNVRRVLETQAKHNAVYDEIFSTDETRQHIKSGHGLQLVVHDDNKIVASIMVEVLNTEVGRSLNLTTLGGTGMDVWGIMLLKTLKNIAIEFNCNDIRIYMVRPGWYKKLKPHGFKSIGNREYAGTMYPVISYKIRG